MKRQSLLFIAGGLLALASCTNDANTGDNMSQAQIDSAVNARVEEMSIQMQASNDSLINEMAMIKADSICGAMGNKTTTTTSTRKPSKGGNTTTTTNTGTKAPTTGNGKPTMTNTNNDPNTTGQGKPKMTNTNADPNTTGQGKPKMTK